MSNNPDQLPVDQMSKPLSDGGIALATQLAESNASQWFRFLYGGALSFVAVGALIGLAFAYLPFTFDPEPQVAAAVEAEEIDYFEGVDVGARAAYVYDVKHQKELYAKEAHLQLPLASITKVMLVLAVAEVLKPEDIVTISLTAIEKGGNGLTWGEEWRMKDLVDYTLITSSNTGAEALAEAADAKLRAKYPEAPRGGAAVWRMNALAQEIGLNETYFINPSGLDEGLQQAGALGSAKDIARLFEYALQKDRQLFAGTTRSGVILGPINYLEREAHNTNNALAEIPGILMGKTGTTDLAGGNLAVAFDAGDNQAVIAVVIGSTQDGRYADIKKLVETAQKAVSGAH